MYSAYTFLRSLVPPLFFTTAAVILLFAIVNAVADVYRKDNAAVKRAKKLLSSRKDSLAALALALPLCYKYQWQLFMRVNDKRASKLFSFCPKSDSITFHFLPTLLTLSCLALTLAETIFLGDVTSYVIYGGVAIGLLMVLAVCYAARGLRCKRAKAKKLFEKLVGDMDLLFGDHHDFELEQQPTPTEGAKKSKNPLDDVIDKVKFLKQKGLTEQSAQRIAELISQQKLSQPRTVAQQRKLNEALNGLVRYVSMKESANPDANQ